MLKGGSRLWSLCCVVVAALLLMTTAIIDGRPSVFYDSHSYDVVGQDMVEVLHKLPASLLSGQAMGPTATDSEIYVPTMGARSPFYGVFVYALSRLGTLWLLAGLQALAAAWVVFVFWRAAAPQARLRSYLGLISLLTLGSSLPFFSTFAMPDVFAGVGGLAMIVLLVYADRLRRWETLTLWLLCFLTFAFHRSHLLTAVVVAPMAVGLMWLCKAKPVAIVARSVMVLSAIAAATLAGAAWDAGYYARTHQHLGRPPFLMARLLADGPGRRYLRSVCTDSSQPFHLCRFKNQPLLQSENVLWSDSPKIGVFNISTTEGQLSLEAEETRFALGALAYAPVEAAAQGVKNWVIQMAKISVHDPLRDPASYLYSHYWRTTRLVTLEPDIAQCRPIGPGCRPVFDILGVMITHAAVILAALAFLGWRLTRADAWALVRRPDWTDERVRAIAAAVLIIGLVIINAAVCGILSGPFARYQARIVWLVPMAAGVIACALSPAYARAIAERGWLWLQRLQLPRRLQSLKWAAILDRPVLRFGVVGLLGFSVDAAVLEILAHGLGLNPYLSRLISFAVAVFATWAANRSWTFRHARSGVRPFREAMAYVAVQCTGGAVNLAVYAAAIKAVPQLSHWLPLPLALGSAAGMAINFLGSKHLVFTAKAGPSPS